MWGPLRNSVREGLSCGDPVRVGVVTNLARPGGSITGLSALTFEMEEKRLELLKELLIAPMTMGIVGVALLAASAVIVTWGTLASTGQRNQLGSQCRVALVPVLRPAVFEVQILALDVAPLPQALPQALDRRPPLVGQHSNAYRLRHPLLRARRERPCRGCAAEQRDELAPS
jgi:hypothetical protein